MTTRPVVVAVDGSGESLQAVEWAVSEAQLHDTPLRIASVASLPKMGVLGLQPERDAVLGYVRAQRDRVLATAAARAAQMAPGLLIDTDPIEGQAARAVTESGSGALMLVTGFCGTGAFAATVLGSVAQYAADHASCPVVVVRDQAAAAHRLVGVGLGDLEGCADALVRVRGGGPAQGPLMAIHAWHAPQASITWPGDRFLPPGLNVAAADAARQLALLMDQWREKYPDVPVSEEVVHGHPGRALAGLSARAEMVVIGRHASHPGLPRPGCVRHAMLNHAHGPIAIVPSS